jgi:hypothetical protein
MSDSGLSPSFQERRIAMDKSLIFYWDRTNCLNIVDSGAIPHFNNGHPVLNIIVDIINAGYQGVIIDEKRLSNGKYVHALSVDLNSPEGVAVSAIQKSFEANEPLPTSREVIESINHIYEAAENDEY